MNISVKGLVTKFVVFGILAIQSIPTYSQTAQTGTRIKDSTAGTGYARRTFQLDVPEEVTRIRQLLENGKVEESLSLALNYLEYIEANVQDKKYFYHAYNALCAVYIKSGELKSAVTACSEAVESKQDEWSALNNRGTAYLLLEDYDKAKADFSEAQSVAIHESRNVREVISHNMNLVNSRMEP